MQSIENIINRNFLYVDKTDIIHRLITDGQYYFLSRPRRFGKSLLLSTLEAIFKGDKELFKNCHIYNTDYDSKKHPVISILRKSQRKIPKNWPLGCREFWKTPPLCTASPSTAQTYNTD